MQTTGCSRCGDAAPPRRAPRAAWVLLPVIWALLIPLGALCALLVPLNLVLVPAWLAAASSVGPFARELLDPKCGSCGAPRVHAQRHAHRRSRADASEDPRGGPSADLPRPQTRGLG